MVVLQDSKSVEILLVDDNPADVRLAEEALKEGGIDAKLRVAEDGLAATEVLRDGVQTIDLVLTDLQMPRMDGLALVEHIRTIHPGLPVILITAYGNEEIAFRALKKGAASYVPKKNLIQDLADTVAEVFSVAHAGRQRRRVIECLTRTESEYHLSNDLTLIAPLVAHLQENLVRMRLCDETEVVRVGVALHEALVNAIEHGNLELDSEFRERDLRSYEELARRRRQQPPYRDRGVRIVAKETRSEAVYRIRDDGPGFDPSTLPDPTDPANLEKVSGRGLLLVRTFMDEVHHNDRGNEIQMIKRRTS